MNRNPDWTLQSIDLNLAANLAYRISPHHYVGVNAGV